MKYSTLPHWAGLFRPLEDKWWFATLKSEGKQFRSSKDGNSGEESAYLPILNTVHVPDYHILEKTSLEKIWLCNIIWYSAVTLDNEKEEGETCMGKEICQNNHVYS